MALTQRQQQILDYIRRYLAENEFPPSIREIMRALNISSTSVVNYNLNVLVEKGYITRHRELARGIRLVELPAAPEEEQAEAVVSIPILGTIAAGVPIPVPDTISVPEDYIRLTRDITQEAGDIYALRVRGDSMIDALINDGDIVIMKHQKEARNGELVAVWLKNEKETTLKRFYREGNRVRLQPANPFMEPIYTSADNVEIQGKVILIIRQPGLSSN